MGDQNHKPPPGDRNLGYVAGHDEPQQDRQNRESTEGEKQMGDAAKRGGGVR